MFLKRVRIFSCPQENSPIPKRNNGKTASNPSLGGGGIGGGMDLSERTSQHSPGSAGSRPNCADDDDAGERSDGGGSNGNSNGLLANHDEPPMDYSRTHQAQTVAAAVAVLQQQQLQHQQQQLQLQQDTAQNLMVPRRSSPSDVKSEPMDISSTAPVNSGSAYGADDSNDSAADFTGVHPAIGMSEPDDTSYQSHHSYLDSKFFAAAGATFNFSMAAAMAADSLAGKCPILFI